MSHFSCLVFSQDGKKDSVEKLLEPYWEGKEVPKRDYKSFDEILKEVRDYILSQETNEERKEYFLTEYLGRPEKEIVARWEGLRGDMVDEERRMTYSTYNPNSKWDWYQIGGRFKHFLKARSGQEVLDGKIKNLDFRNSESEMQRLERVWDLVVENEMAENDEEMAIINFTSKKDLIDCFGTKETYMLENRHSLPFAFVTPDGTWHEAATMGWFGLTFDTSRARQTAMVAEFLTFIDDPKNQDLFCTIVDCHI